MASSNLAPASFCKCTCFSNSTIIPLDPDSSESASALNGVSHFLRRSDDTHSLSGRAKNYRSLNCNDCNRKFCLDYDLPTCHGAKEDDVFTTCFRMAQFFFFKVSLCLYSYADIVSLFRKRLAERSSNSIYFYYCYRQPACLGNVQALGRKVARGIFITLMALFNGIADSITGCKRAAIIYPNLRNCWPLGMHVTC